MSDRIAIGVGLGVGLPAAIVAIWQMIRWLGPDEVKRVVVRLENLRL